MPVKGTAWLDREWSSSYLDPNAVGWDWVGLNLDDGGAVMAFRIRDRQGKTYWSAATVREPDGQTQTFGQQAIEFTVQRRWRSPHTGVSYPVSDLVRIGARQFKLEPLLDDQENDIEGRCVAVAIPAQRVHYAISVSGITSRFPMSKAVDVARAIREMVSELSEQAMPPIKPYS